MEEYIEYLEGKIEELKADDMHITASVYQDALDTYLSMLDADSLRISSKGNKIVIAHGDRSIGKVVRFAEMLASMNKAHILSSSAASQGVAMVAGNFGGQERGLTLHKIMEAETSIAYRALPRITETENLIPLDKYGKPLESPKSKYHK